jgi:hypothetical protein
LEGLSRKSSKCVQGGEPLILKDVSLPVSQWDPAWNLFELAKFSGVTRKSRCLRFSWRRA